MQLKILFVLLLIIAGPYGLSAQKLYFRQLRPNISNAPKNITKLLQDKDGFIWLGTEKGLLQFDGITYTPFYPGKPNVVTALFQDDSNKIWQGYKDGNISYFQHGENQVFAPEEGLPKVAINAIKQDKEKRIWFATYGEGVYFFHQNRLYNIDTDDGLADNYTYDLEVDNDGNIWAATDRGISKIHISNGKKIVRNITQSTHNLPDNLVTALAFDGLQTIWVGTQSGGFCWYDIKKDTIINRQITWASGQINNIMAKPNFQGNLYFIGTEKDGLLQLNADDPYKKNAINIYNRKDLFGLTKITDQLIDKEGNLWIAGGTEHLCMAPTEVQLLDLSKFTELKSIRAIEKLGETYWLGTEKGVFLYNPENDNLTRTQIQELSQANITSIKNMSGTLWFGTLGQGIYIYDTAEKWFKHLTEKDGLVNDNVLSISSGNNSIISGSSNLHVATLGGISKISIGKNKYTFTNLSRANGLPADYIYQVYEDKKGVLWFCTDGHGLIKLHNSKYTIYDEKHGLNSQTVISISPANDKNSFYVATPEDGLFLFNGERFRKLNFGNDITSNSIRAVLNDRQKQTIIVHANGIDIVDPESNEVKTYRNEIGLEGTDPELNAWKTDNTEHSSGEIILALGNKILHYLNTIPNTIAKPQTRIKNISLFLDTIPANKTSFSYDENHISFDYVGLWFHNPEEVTYQVKLEGYDPDWVNTRNHFITYPNLPPGKYTFYVRSSATDNFTNASMASYEFRISAPFWKRAWFYVPLISLLIAGGYFYIRQREKILKKEAAISRQNIEFQYETLRSQVNPHFLFNSFNTLAGVIETDQKMAVEYVENLSDFFRNLLVYKDKDVISLKEELSLLENYFFIQKKRFGQNLHLSIEVEEKYKRWLLPPLCLQLLIENAIKHNIISREKPLHITIQTTNDAKLVVKNNYQLKTFAEKSTGIGLANIKSRYSLLTKAPVNVVQDDYFFTVELPLIAPEK